MASIIKKGESILIPFRDGLSISDSQLKPRMYKTMKAFEKAFPRHYLGTNGVELVEYAPVVRCKDCKHYVAPQGTYVCDCFEGLNFATHNDFCSYGERRTDD